MPGPEAELSIVDGAANLKQKIDTPSRPTHLLLFVHPGIHQKIGCAFDDPSVPMTMRHWPPASLDLGTGDRHRGYAQHRWPNRPQECGWPWRSPQTDDGPATVGRLARAFPTAPAPDVLRGGEAAHPGGDRPRRRDRRDRRHPASRRPLLVHPDRLAPPARGRRLGGAQAATPRPQARARPTRGRRSRPASPRKRQAAAAARTRRSDHRPPKKVAALLGMPMATTARNETP